MTPAVEYQVGSIFHNTPYDVFVFKACFDFRIGVGTGADGLTFAVLDSAVLDPTSLGNWGMGLGYEGLMNAFAIEFDTWDNGEIDNHSENHVGVDINGSVASVFINSDIPELEDRPGWFRAIVFFQGGNIKVFLRNLALGYRWTKVVDYNINVISFKGYFGFTAATGAATNRHWIDNFSLEIPPMISSAPSKNSASIATQWGDLKKRD